MFVSILSNFHFNVFGISGSCLSSSIYDHEVLHSDYILYSNDRVCLSGGVFIAVHNSTSGKIISSK